MDFNFFGKKFRAVRDRGLPPEESWRVRRGHLLMGCTFSVHSEKSLTGYKIEDMMVSLLDAASKSQMTDLQINFTKSSRGDIMGKINYLLTELVASGFTPAAPRIKMDNSGRGWIRMYLFSPDEFLLFLDVPNYSSV